MSRYAIGVAGPDLGRITKEYGTAATDERFTLSMLQSGWKPLVETLQTDEPDLLVLYADIAPSPDSLRDLLSRLKKAVAVVLLPPAWASVQGVIEQVHTVRRVYLLPANPAEVLKLGYSAVETEHAKAQSISPLQNVYSGGGRAAAAVGTRVIAFISAQGGVGRSTLAEALGFELAARRSIRTLLFSCDLPSTAPLRLGLRHHPDAGEFFARPGPGSFRDIVQTTADGLDVIMAPSDSYVYASAAAPRPEHDEGSLRSLVITSYTFNYGAVLLDLPAGEGGWTLQPLLAANTVVIVARPTMDGIRAVAHLSQLLTEKFDQQHRVPREGLFVLLNQRTPKSTFTATAFNQQGASYAGWFPPVLATVDYDPTITQAQDAGRPAASTSELLGKAAQGLADAFYGGGQGLSESQRSRGVSILGVRIRTGS